MNKTLLKTAFLTIVFSLVLSVAHSVEVRYTVEKEADTLNAPLLAAERGEIDLVETMAGFRNSYRASLVELEAYYRSIGNDTKRSWAEKELLALDSIPWYRYITPGDTASQGMRATDVISQADAIYDEALKLEDEAKLLSLVIDDAKLQRALRKYEQVFQSYPTSDKIDNAVYRAATIYEHFKDYEIAILYYQRTYQWNPQTQYNARLKAARLLDYKLNKRTEALELYQASIDKESLNPDAKNTVQRRITELMTSDEKSGIEDDLIKGAPKDTE